MDDGVTLAYLRGLLTLQVILKTPKLTQMDLDFDVVDQAFFASKFLQFAEDIDNNSLNTLSAVRTSETNDYDEVAETFAAANNKFLLGVGDTLQAALLSFAASGYSPTLDSEEYKELAHQKVLNLLAGARHRDRYNFILNEINRSDFDPKTAFRLETDSLQEFLDHDSHWEFWAAWLKNHVGRSNLDQKLLLQVSMINHEIWEAGPEAVATEIERIQAEHFTNQHPLAETIQLNPETNRFYATPTPIQNAPLIGTLLSRVQDSVEDATLGNNGLNDQSREVRVLSRTLTRYANDPQRIEMDFTSVAVGLRRQIHDTADLPNSEGNLALLEAVEDGVRGIRAAHPDIAKNRLLIAQQSLHELSSEHVDLLKDAQPVLVAISEEIMAEDFAVDIPSLINDALQPLPNGAPPLPGADAATRIFNRASHMRLMYGQFIENGSKAFDSKTFKTARLGLTVISMLSALVSLGLYLFGVI
jgi:hypothetical protein